MSSPAQLDTGCKLIDAELDRHFIAPDSELSVEARDHLRHCARCRELYQWGAFAGGWGEGSGVRGNPWRLRTDNRNRWPNNRASERCGLRLIA